MGYRPFKGRCRTCGKVGVKVINHSPGCGWTACANCWNRAGIISRCPNCGKR